MSYQSFKKMSPAELLISVPSILIGTKDSRASEAARVAYISLCNISLTAKRSVCQELIKELGNIIFPEPKTIEEEVCCTIDCLTDIIDEEELIYLGFPIVNKEYLKKTS